MRMALRAGYKGFKKLLAPLKVIRPGVLSVDMEVIADALIDDTSTAADKTWSASKLNADMASKFSRSEQAVLGAKNLFNYDAWKNVEINKGTGVFENNGVTLTATDNDCWTRFNVSEYPIGARIPVSPGQKIKLVWDSDTSDEKGNVYIFPDGLVTGSKYVKNNVEELDYTVPADVSFLTVRFGVTTSGDTISYSNIMVLLQSETDLTYASHAMTNRELTEKVQDLDTKITGIECDKTTAGTYTLSATVDAQGAVTYEWTAVTP